MRDGKERVTCIVHVQGVLGPNRHMCEDTLCLESNCLGQSCVDYGPVSWYDQTVYLLGLDTGTMELES